jgi:hypothetical protein
MDYSSVSSGEGHNGPSSPVSPKFFPNLIILKGEVETQEKSSLRTIKIDWNRDQYFGWRVGMRQRGRVEIDRLPSRKAIRTIFFFQQILRVFL